MLGAHEMYFWGWGSQLLAKLSDGTSFKMFRLGTDFDTVAAQTPSAQADAVKIEQAQKLLFHLPWKTIVEPVFVQDVAVFYIVDSSSAGRLLFYRFNAISNFFELKSDQTVVTTVSTGWETQTSLVRTTTGVLFKANAQSTIYYFAVTDYTYTQSTVTASLGSLTIYSSLSSV